MPRRCCGAYAALSSGIIMFNNPRARLKDYSMFTL
jgi:hypothetical protein